MKTRRTFPGVLLVGLLVWTAAGQGQPPEAGPTKADPRAPAVPPNAPTPTAVDLPPRVDPPAVSPPSVRPVAPAPPTMDQLIDTLSDIRAKKAELEKQEQATIAAIQEKLRAQRERLDKLGVAESPAGATKR